jgi:peptide/nickel transport system permease protein
MRFRKKTILLLVALAGLHVAVLFAGFFSPYDVAQQNRDLPFAPPNRLHFVDTQGNSHFRPFICSSKDRPRAFGEYFEDTGSCVSVRFIVRGSPYTLFGIVKSNVHLFGVDPPAKIFLMGTDAYGRDVFSRFLYGGQISLFAGLMATLLSLAVGTLLGSLAGYFGGWTDAFIMRSAELFLALPWLYFLFAVRAFLPLSLSAEAAFLLLIGVIGLVGWARPARLIRSVVLSSREHHYVLAARLFGASNSYLLRRHILPDTYSILLTQAVLLVPQYVLAEVTLSFLGLGVAEPAPSWGNMLSTLQQYSILVSYWWMLLPGLMLVPVFCGYLLLASELQPGRKAVVA